MRSLQRSFVSKGVQNFPLLIYSFEYWLTKNHRFLSLYFLSSYAYFVADNYESSPDAEGLSLSSVLMTDAISEDS